MFLFEAEPKDSISKSTLANSGRKLAIVELDVGLIGKRECGGIEAAEERRARLLALDDWAEDVLCAMSSASFRLHVSIKESAPTKTVHGRLKLNLKQNSFAIGVRVLCKIIINLSIKHFTTFMEAKIQ